MPIRSTGRPRGGAAQRADQLLRRDREPGLGGSQHAPQPLLVCLASAEVHAERQRHRDQTGVLAGEEPLKKLGRGLGHDRNPRAAGEAETCKALGQVERARAQLAVRQHLLERAAGREEVASRLATRGVVQPLRQRGETARAKGQCRVGGRSGDHRSLFSCNHRSGPCCHRRFGRSARTLADRTLLSDLVPDESLCVADCYSRPPEVDQPRVGVRELGRRTSPPDRQPGQSVADTDRREPKARAGVEVCPSTSGLERCSGRDWCSSRRDRQMPFLSLACRRRDLLEQVGAVELVTAAFAIASCHFFRSVGFFLGPFGFHEETRPTLKTRSGHGLRAHRLPAGVIMGEKR